MQLMVSVAVVLIALSAAATGSTENVKKELTMAEKFEKFQQDVQTFVDDLGEKTIAFLDSQKSEYREWLHKTLQRLKEKFEFDNPSGRSA